MKDNRTSSGLRPGIEGGELALFGNVEWGVRAYDGIDVLTATVDGVLHYEAAGLCRITEHRNVPDAIATHVAEHQKTKLNISAAHATIGAGYSGATWANVGPNPYRWFITREGANRLVLDSRVAGAQRIKNWLADDVMPSVEDTGSYVAPGAALADVPDPATPEGAIVLADIIRTQALARIEDAKTIAQQASRIKALEPAEALMKTYSGAKGLTTKRAFARDVQQWALDEGLDISQQQVFDFLNHIGLFIRSDTSEYDQAKSQAIKDRKAKNVTVKIEHADGSIEKKKYGKLTAKGEDFAWRRIHEAIDTYGTLDLDVIRGVLVPAGPEGWS